MKKSLSSVFFVPGSRVGVRGSGRHTCTCYVMDYAVPFPIHQNMIMVGFINCILGIWYLFRVGFRAEERRDAVRRNWLTIVNMSNIWAKAPLMVRFQMWNL